MKVKQAWKMVAMKEMSYAEAIKTVSQPDSADAARTRRDDENRARGRADLIGAPSQSSHRSNWASKLCFPQHKPEMVSTETQTEPEQVEVQTHTTSEAGSQTIPERKEKKVQTSKDKESQTVEVEITMQPDDKFIATTFLFAINMLVKHGNESIMHDADYLMFKERYNKTIIMMSERQYPIASTLAAAAKANLPKRQTTNKK